jgi:hypothetical protein
MMPGLNWGSPVGVVETYWRMYAGVSSFVCSNV